MKLHLIFLIWSALFTISKTNSLAGIEDNIFSLPSIIESIINRIIEKFLIFFINTFKPWVANELPCLEILSLDPFHIVPFRINFTTPYITAVAGFKNFAISGLRFYETIRAKPNLRRLSLEVEMFFPNVTLSGDYYFKGSAWIIPMFGKGRFTIDVSEIRVKVYGRFMFPPFAKELNISNFDYFISLGALKVNFEDFYGGSFLGDAVNGVANLLGRSLFHYFEKVLHMKAIAKLEDLINQYFDHVSISELLEDYFDLLRKCFQLSVPIGNSIIN